MGSAVYFKIPGQEQERKKLSTCSGLPNCHLPPSLPVPFIDAYDWRHADEKQREHS